MHWTGKANPGEEQVFVMGLVLYIYTGPFTKLGSSIDIH